MDKEKIFIYGASGHARVVIDIIERQGLYEIVFLVDDDPGLQNTEVSGYRVLGGKDELLTGRMEFFVTKCVVAIGDNQIRNSVADSLVEQEFKLGHGIHPDACIGSNVEIGFGTVVMAGVTINPDVRIGNNVIVNTGVLVDHDCDIKAGVHLAPGSVLCGTVSVGKGSFVGAGATITPNVAIGANAIVSAGAVVISDVPAGVSVVGVPAKKIG